MEIEMETTIHRSISVFLNRGKERVLGLRLQDLLG